MRVRLTQLARDRRLEKKHAQRFGEGHKLGDGFWSVLWDGVKTRQKYHPSYIEPDVSISENVT